MANLYTVNYPRDFQIQNRDILVQRAATLLSLGLGEDANKKFLRDLYEALFPRMEQDEMDALVDSSAAALSGPVYPPGVIPPGGAVPGALPVGPNGEVIPPPDSQITPAQSAARDRALKILQNVGLAPPTDQGQTGNGMSPSP